MTAWFAALAGDTVISKLLVTFFVSMLPVVELRAGLPFGISLGLSPWAAVAASVLGNLLPVPFIIIFIRRIFNWMCTRSERLKRWVDKRVEKTLKYKDKLYKSQILGLIVLVAIPLPGTGAWTGALLAALLNIRLKVAFPSICAGVVIASLLVLGITLGFTSIF